MKNNLALTVVIFLKSWGRFMLLVSALSLSFSLAGAADYRNQLVPGLILRYQHWNTKKEVVTGYSLVSVELLQEGGSERILETTQNIKPDGTLFNEKKIWFDSTSGTPLRYQEEDLRTEQRISSVYSKKEIQTQMVEKGREVKLVVPMASGLIPFEILIPALQQEIPDLIQNQDIKYTLYLSSLLPELLRRNLPLVLSRFPIKAHLDKSSTLQGAWGKTEAVQLIVKPSSELIYRFLPKNRSEFRFTFAAQYPHYLLVFEEGDTRMILQEINKLQQVAKKNP